MPIDSEPTDLPASRAVEAAVAGPAPAAVAESPSRGHPAHTLCQNCGTALTGPFCHRCGQHDLDFHQSIGHVLLEALENLFHFDAKLFQDTITLLFRPGRLSAEFNAGRRAAQMPPFRLYLFVSVLFFFTRFLGEEHASGTDAPPPRGAAVALSAPAAKPPVASSGNAPHISIKLPDRPPSSNWERFMEEKGRYAVGHQQELQEAFLHALPKMLLFCLPLMAWYTRLLFRHSGQVFLQHLIVALHYHTFVYLWWLVVHGWKELIGWMAPGVANLVGVAAAVWMALYPLLMLRRLFGQSLGRTLVKTAALAVLYGLTLALGFLLTAMIVFVLF